MKPRCELIAIHVLPTVRAIIAKKLMSEHGYTQKRVADKMGLTQPAVSQYKSSLRGNKAQLLLNNQNVSAAISDFAKKIYSGISVEQQTLEFCALCKLMVSEGLACQMHRDIDESVSACTVCEKKS